jgi:predicted nucleic acid-binding protein
VLVDDGRARKRISAAGFRVSGAVGVLMAGLRRDYVSGPEVLSVLQAWEKLGFRLSRGLVSLLQEKAGAIPLQNPRGFYDDWDDPEVDAAWCPKKKS